MKVSISKKDYSIEADEVLEKKAVKFGSRSAHIIVPKEWIGKDVILIAKALVKQWTRGYLKKYKPTTWKKVKEVEDKALKGMD
jgi:putative transposon-encoded protein